MARGSGGSGGWRSDSPPEISVDLDSLASKQAGAQLVLEGRISAFVRRGEIPVATNVEFLVGGQNTTHTGPGLLFQTSDDGTASDDFSVRVSNSATFVVIEARAISTSGNVTRARKNVPIPRDAVPDEMPSDLQIKSEGKDGYYTVNATIVNKDGRGVRGVIRVVRKQEPPQAGHVLIPEDYQTDKGGDAFFGVQVTEPIEEVHLLVLGTSIDKTLKLLGSKPSKVRYRRPLGGDLEKGPFHALRAGWRAGKGRKK